MFSCSAKLISRQQPLLRAPLSQKLLATSTVMGPRRGFTAQKPRNNTGFPPREFDFNFEQKMDYGRFPHNY